MEYKLKERLQCRDCKIPYCDALCTDLSDEQIDWIMDLAKLSKREYFAAKALQGLSTIAGSSVYQIAWSSVDIADELIRRLKQD